MNFLLNIKKQNPDESWSWNYLPIFSLRAWAISFQIISQIYGFPATLSRSFTLSTDISQWRSLGSLYLSHFSSLLKSCTWTPSTALDKSIDALILIYILGFFLVFVCLSFARFEFIFLALYDVKREDIANIVGRAHEHHLLKHVWFVWSSQHKGCGNTAHRVSLSPVWAQCDHFELCIIQSYCRVSNNTIMK